MKQNDKAAIAKLIERNTTHLFLLCNDFSAVSDTKLEELIASHIQDNLRIVQKLKAMI